MRFGKHMNKASQGLLETGYKCLQETTSRYLLMAIGKFPLLNNGQRKAHLLALHGKSMVGIGTNHERWNRPVGAHFIAP
jgi:hypothetical protein